MRYDATSGTVIDCVFRQKMIPRRYAVEELFE